MSVARMPSTPSAIVHQLTPEFRCTFCRDPLRRERARGAEIVLYLVSFRVMSCPHCLKAYYRPWGIPAIPVLIYRAIVVRLFS